jgi:hypothetical protein
MIGFYGYKEALEEKRITTRPLTITQNTIIRIAKKASR